MKKSLQIGSLIFLFVFSFFLTNKIRSIVKNMDTIMIKIKENYKTYEILGMDAKCYNDRITPGISTKLVDISSSYNKMRKNGDYNPKYYVYNTIKPDVSIDNNKDKYIFKGNSIKKMISINFIINDTKSIKDIIWILNKNKVKATFFVNDEWILNNLEFANSMKKSNFIIGLNKVNNYKNIKTIIKKILKEKNIYCTYYNKKSIKNCSKINGYTIKGKIVNNNFL